MLVLWCRQLVLKKRGTSNPQREHLACLPIITSRSISHHPSSDPPPPPRTVCVSRSGVRRARRRVAPGWWFVIGRSARPSSGYSGTERDSSSRPGRNRRRTRTRTRRRKRVCRRPPTPQTATPVGGAPGGGAGGGNCDVSRGRAVMATLAGTGRGCKEFRVACLISVNVMCPKRWEVDKNVPKLNASSNYFVVITWFPCGVLFK